MRVRAARIGAGRAARSRTVVASPRVAAPWSAVQSLSRGRATSAPWPRRSVTSVVPLGDVVAVEDDEQQRREAVERLEVRIRARVQQLGRSRSRPRREEGEQQHRCAVIRRGRTGRCRRTRRQQRSRRRSPARPQDCPTCQSASMTTLCSRTDYGRRRSGTVTAWSCIVRGRRAERVAGGMSGRRARPPYDAGVSDPRGSGREKRSARRSPEVREARRDARRQARESPEARQAYRAAKRETREARMATLEDRYALAAILIVITIITTAIGGDHRWGQFILVIVESATLIVILHASNVARKTIRIVTILVLVAAVLHRDLDHPRSPVGRPGHRRRGDRVRRTGGDRAPHPRPRPDRHRDDRGVAVHLPARRHLLLVRVPHHRRDRRPLLRAEARGRGGRLHLLLLHDAHHDRLRRLHRRHQLRADARDLGGAGRPDLPRERRRAARRQPRPRAPGAVHGGRRLRGRRGRRATEDDDAR